MKRPKSSKQREKKIYLGIGEQEINNRQLMKNNNMFEESQTGKNNSVKYNDYYSLKEEEEIIKEQLNLLMNQWDELGFTSDYRNSFLNSIREIPKSGKKDIIVHELNNLKRLADSLIDLKKEILIRENNLDLLKKYNNSLENMENEEDLVNNVIQETINIIKKLRKNAINIVSKALQLNKIMDKYLSSGKIDINNIKEEYIYDKNYLNKMKEDLLFLQDSALSKHIEMNNSKIDPFLTNCAPNANKYNLNNKITIPIPEEHMKLIKELKYSLLQEELSNNSNDKFDNNKINTYYIENYNNNKNKIRYKNNYNNNYYEGRYLNKIRNNSFVSNNQKIKIKGLFVGDINANRKMHELKNIYGPKNYEGLFLNKNKNYRINYNNFIPGKKVRNNYLKLNPNLALSQNKIKIEREEIKLLSNNEFINQLNKYQTEYNYSNLFDNNNRISKEDILKNRNIKSYEEEELLKFKNMAKNEEQNRIDLEKDVDNLQIKLKEMTERVREYEEELKKANIKRKKKERELNNKIEILEKGGKNENELIEKIKNLEEKLKKEQNLRKSKENEIEDMKIKYKNEEEKRIKEENEKNKKNEMLLKIKEEKRKKEEEEKKKNDEEQKMEYEKEKERMSEELQKKQNIIKEMDEEKNRIENEKNKIENDYNILKEEKDKLENDYNSLKEEKDKNENDNNLIKEEKERMENNYNSLKEEKDKVENDYNSLKEEKDKLENDYNSIKEEKNKLENDYNSLKEEKSKMEKDYNNLNEQKVKIENDYNILKEEKTNLENNYNNLNQEKTQIENDYNKLKEEKINLENQINNKNLENKEENKVDNEVENKLDNIEENKIKEENKFDNNIEENKNKEENKEDINDINQSNQNQEIQTDYKIDYYKGNISNLVNFMSDKITLEIIPDFLVRAFMLSDSIYSEDYYFKGIFPKIIVSTKGTDEEVTGVCSLYYESNENLRENLILRINSIFAIEDWENQITKMIDFIKNNMKFKRLELYVLYDKKDNKFIQNQEAKNLFQTKLGFKWLCVVRDEKLQQRYIKLYYNKESESEENLENEQNLKNGLIQKNNFYMDTLTVITVNNEKNTYLLKNIINNESDDINLFKPCYNKFINPNAIYSLISENPLINCQFTNLLRGDELKQIKEKIWRFVITENSWNTKEEDKKQIKNINFDIDNSVYKQIEKYYNTKDIKCSCDLYKNNISINFENNYSILIDDIYYNKISTEKIKIIREKETKSLFFLIPSNDNTILFYISEVNKKLRNVLLDNHTNIYDKFLEFQPSTQKEIIDFSTSSFRDITYIPQFIKSSKTLYIPSFIIDTHLFSYNFKDIKKNVNIEEINTKESLNLTSVDEYLKIEFKPDENIENCFSVIPVEDRKNNIVIKSSFIIGIFDNDIINNNKLPLMQFLYVTKDNFLTVSNYNPKQVTS